METVKEEKIVEDLTQSIKELTTAVNELHEFLKWQEVQNEDIQAGLELYLTTPEGNA